MKELLLVCLGSFAGGGTRFLVSKAVQGLTAVHFPLGTMTVNVLGCLVIGFLSTLPLGGSSVQADTRLFLTTGFCGGFTTFSTFMNETVVLTESGHAWLAVLYLAASLFFGALAVVCGYMLGRLV